MTPTNTLPFLLLVIALMAIAALLPQAVTFGAPLPGDTASAETYPSFDLQDINHRTRAQCKIPCPHSPGKYPTRREAAECMFRYYHPDDLQEDEAKFDLLARQVGRLRNSSKLPLPQQHLYLLVGDIGIGKTYFMQTVSLVFYNHYNVKRNWSNTSPKFHNKDQVLMEFDCGTIEEEIARNRDIDAWFYSQVSEYLVKEDSFVPFIVFKNLLKCSKTSAHQLIIAMLNGSTPITTVFATMENTAVSDDLPYHQQTPEEVSARTEKMLIDKYGTGFRKLVSIHPFKPWGMLQHMAAMQKTIDNIPCDVGSKVTKLSYTKPAMEWYAYKMLRLAEVSGLHNGKTVEDFVESEVKSKINNHRNCRIKCTVVIHFTPTIPDAPEIRIFDDEEDPAQEEYEIARE